MKYLIAELLDKLVEKEVESKELVAQVEALVIVVSALLRKLDDEQRKEIHSCISHALEMAAEEINPEDTFLLYSYVDKLLNPPHD